jgi:hypothetical protein
MRVRTAAFARAELLFGADLPVGGNGEKMDLYRACATCPLEIHVHDRVVQEEVGTTLNPQP